MASSLLLLSCASHAIPAARTRILLPQTSSPRAGRCPPCLVTAKPEALLPRRSGNYPPSLWDDAHIQSITSDFNEEPTDRIEKLKEDVKWLLKEKKEVVEQLELVDVLQQLGVAYHFEEDIIGVLTNIYASVEELNMKMKGDLYAKALLFRLLREHGFSISQDVTTEVLDNFKNYPDIVRWSCMILRLSDDLATSTEELQRGDVQKSIQCYIYEKGISEFSARNQIRDLIGLSWKRLNQERILGASRFEKTFKRVAFNIPRTAQCIYQYGDGYGMQAGSETKDRILSVLIDPILL